jgi:erythromycin esterase-like protein
MDGNIAAELRRHALPVGDGHGYRQVIDSVGDASVVLLGEATHGSAEFYRARAEISKLLITEKGFSAIAVEADWPDALRVTRYVRGGGRRGRLDMDAHQALAGFQRFPLWMWRNTEIASLVEWLRTHNQQFEDATRRVGFYGLDLYSLRSSMEAVVRYLSKVDPEAAQRARARYSCFDQMAEDPQRYGYATTFGMKKDCEDEVVRQLVELTAEAGKDLAESDDPVELFYAQQNARVAQNAEAYYRAMFRSRDESWNLRDTHMVETLAVLREHLSRDGQAPKLIVWAHNSHIGDASATELGRHGQLNLGQLARELYGEDVFLLGFTTHEGTVTAASDWEGETERKTVRPSMPDSVERLLHDVGLPSFLLPIRENNAVANALPDGLLERAIGVIYLPESERISHYFQTNLAAQFDAILHIDRTTALQPLDQSPSWRHDEVPDTYPSGI